MSTEVSKPGEWKPVKKNGKLLQHHQPAHYTSIEDFSISYGLDFKRHSKFNLRNATNIGFKNNFHFVTVPLSTGGETPGTDITLTHSLTSGGDTEHYEMDGQQSYLTGKIADFVDFSDPAQLKHHENILNREMSWSAHLGINYVMLSPAAVKSSSRIVSLLVNAVKQYQFSTILVPCEFSDEGWRHWNLIRTGTSHHTRILPMLLIGEDLPDRSVQTRWFGESISCFSVDASLFLCDVNANLQLPTAHGDVLYRFWYTNQPTSVMISGAHDNEVDPFKAMHGLKRVMTLRLRQLTEDETFEKQYFDVLQHPLQPLMNNLSFSTYATFEKDVVKYEQYEKAILARLTDLKVAGVKKPVVIMVCGAGRGPLVDRSISASAKSNVPIKLWVVEKNPNAMVTLRAHKNGKWAKKGLVPWGKLDITLVHTDMRMFAPKEKADIIVSELLGSFGDNELSPECLDGVEHLIAENGISIPCDYTSYIAPVTTTRLHREVMDNLKNSETPYVVRLHNFYQITPAQKCWTFHHPNPKTGQGPLRNARSSVVTFDTIPQDCVCHGLAGYFHATLYKDVDICIEPRNPTKDMYSWFPIWFPLREPLAFMEGDVVSAAVWRKVTRTKVWYEWMFTAPRPSKIHNPAGRSYWVGL